MRNVHAKVSDPNSFSTCHGSSEHIIYSAKVMDDGTIKLKEAGKENIQQKIDSFRDSTDMAYILHRLAQGDTSVLNQKQPMFGDFTKTPKNLAETLQMHIDAENAFYKLPLEVRSKFDNDFNKWFSSAGTERWLENMGYEKKEQDIEPDPVKEKEVSE